ncbi:methylmalonyl-CoA mutase family protein [Brevibacillus sp. NRS-1366]|uniref:methylmalonyl-CoA mutase family protein n=1 Tax=Brevibacillus sp. NRS-1366 TaxID=3233899 RepID=UPI003D2082F3
MADQKEGVNMIDEETCLFNEFPIPTYQQWRQIVEKSLKGASFNERLVTQTYEGIELQPIYREEDAADIPHLSSLPGFFPYVRGTEFLGYVKKPWEVCQEMIYRDPVEFNKAIRQELERGQTMINLRLDRAGLRGVDPHEAKKEDIGQGGVSISSVKDFDEALKGICLEKTPVFLQVGSVGLPIYAFLIAAIHKQNQDINELRGCIGMDPLGELAKEGTLPFSLKKAYGHMAHILSWAKEHTPRLQTILVKSDPYHDAGGSAVHELAFALSTGVEYVREMQKHGFTIEDIASRIRFSFSIGSHVFMEIAKLRAARMLWATIVKSFGGSESAQKMTIHARTSAWSKTVYDPYVNMLRSTAEAFAAIIGGVDSLHVTPFDESIRPPDEFSRRIARNSQLILQQEAHLSKVIDPAGGSWYVEVLTDSLAQKVWTLFQEVERNGGMLKALEKSFPQTQVAQVAAQRAENISYRKDKIVGTNMYTNNEETSLSDLQAETRLLQEKRIADANADRSSRDENNCRKIINDLGEVFHSESNHAVNIAIRAAMAGVTIGEFVKTIGQKEEGLPSIKAVPVHRGAELFESLRKAMERHKEKTGKKLQVFLANLGPIAEYKRRVDFTKGFFEVGGFEVIQNQGYETVDEAAQSAIDSRASIVVICSTDEAYMTNVPLVTKRIKETNSDTTIMLAGYPTAEKQEMYKRAGVDDFLHIQTNCYEMLFKLQKEKGIWK